MQKTEENLMYSHRLKGEIRGIKSQWLEQFSASIRDKFKQLSESMQEIQSNEDKLNTEIAQFNDECDSAFQDLKRKGDTLEEKRQILQDEDQDIARRYKVLEQKYGDLQQKYQDLKKSYIKLQQDCKMQEAELKKETLKIEIAKVELEEKISDIKIEKADLEKQEAELAKEIEKCNANKESKKEYFQQTKQKIETKRQLLINNQISIENAIIQEVIDDIMSLTKAKVYDQKLWEEIKTFQESKKKLAAEQTRLQESKKKLAEALITGLRSLLYVKKYLSDINLSRVIGVN